MCSKLKYPLVVLCDKFFKFLEYLKVGDSFETNDNSLIHLSKPTSLRNTFSPTNVVWKHRYLILKVYKLLIAHSFIKKQTEFPTLF
jgi:hypothetical protein